MDEEIFLGIFTVAFFLILLAPTLIALILCLTLIKNKEYKKLSNKQIYAGFWYRFLAGLIDYILLSIISLILAFIPIFGWILLPFVSWLYFTIQHSSSSQATLGMKAVDIKITDEQHKKISFWRATGNYFVSTISAMILFIGFIMIAFTSRKQGLHNFISRTLYIKIK